MKQLFLFLGAMWAVHAFSQTFSNDYGVFDLGWDEDATNVEFINDSIYILYDQFNSDAGYSSCISNISLDGSIIWSKCIGDEDELFQYSFTNPNCMDVSPNSSKYAFGRHLEKSSDDGLHPINLGQLVLLDQHFDTLYTRIIGDSINHYSLSQTRFTPDGGVVLVGFYHDDEFGQGDFKILLVKFDLDGNEEWQTIHNNSVYPDETAWTVSLTSNGGYIVGGVAQDYDSFESISVPVITLFNSNGEYVSHKTFCSEACNAGRISINNLSDGNFVLSGSAPVSELGSKYFVSKIDENLNTIWEMEYDYGFDYNLLFQAKENLDGTIIACGSGYIDEEFVIGDRYGVILKVTNDGEAIWQRTYSYVGQDLQENYLGDIVEIPNGGGYIASGTRSGEIIGKNAWVLKVDDMGCLVEGCDTIVNVEEEDIESKFDFLVGPNPASSFLNVFIPQLPSNIVSTTLTLRDVQGRLVESVPIYRDNTTYIFDLQDQTSGTYFLSLYNGNELLSSKQIVKE